MAGHSKGRRAIFCFHEKQEAPKTAKYRPNNTGRL